MVIQNNKFTNWFCEIGIPHVSLTVRLNESMKKLCESYYCYKLNQYIKRVVWLSQIRNQKMTKFSLLLILSTVLADLTAINRLFNSLDQRSRQRDHKVNPLLFRYVGHYCCKLGQSHVNFKFKTVSCSHFLEMDGCSFIWTKLPAILHCASHFDSIFK